MVEFQDVSVTYGNGVDALNNVSLKIKDGEFAFVVGPSGAGKSTLIKLILKEVSPTSGRVLVNGFSIYSFSASGGTDSKSSISLSIKAIPMS